MDLVLTEEQSMLRRAAKDFVASRSPLTRVRKVRDAGSDYAPELWKEMAALGWLGLAVSEESGGSGLGYRYLMVVLEELGKGLVPEPLLGTAVIGATAIEAGGSKEQKAEHLPAIVAGERIVALAHTERHARYALAAVDTSAEATGGGYVLRGEKVHVMDGTIADWLLVSARTDGTSPASPERGLHQQSCVALFLVPAKSKGVSVTRETRIDGRSCATVRLDGVTVGSGAVLGEVSAGLGLLERVVDAGTIGLTAEMLGAMTATLAMTVAYLGTRVQFGVPIGSFQALQHRAARLYVEIELARSAVWYAHGVLDGLDPTASIARAASVAKAKGSDAFMLVAHEAVQMHGGIGMTEEHDVGLFLKRARVAEMTFGDAGHHEDRFARLAGF